MSYLTDRPVAQGAVESSSTLLWGSMLLVAAGVGLFFLLPTKSSSSKRKGWLSQRTRTRRVCEAKNLQPRTYKHITC